MTARSCSAQVDDGLWMPAGMCRPWSPLVRSAGIACQGEMMREMPYADEPPSPSCQAVARVLEAHGQIGRAAGKKEKKMREKRRGPARFESGRRRCCGDAPAWC